MHPPLHTMQAGPSRISLWDGISVIIGIVIGAGIYETPPMVFRQVTGPGSGLAVWALGGLLTLIGALCWAELASTYRHPGGDYFWLGRAFGRWMGFLFGWAQLAAVHTAGIAMMAYIFADYAGRLWGLGPDATCAAALLAVVVLTGVNVAGLRTGRTAQNLLTASKVLGLGAVLAAGFLFAPAVEAVAPAAEAEAAGPGGAGAAPGGLSSLAMALVLVFLTFGGWNDAAYIAGEMRRREVALALVLGTAAVTVIYFAVNAAFLNVLGFSGVRSSRAVAAECLEAVLGQPGRVAISLLVMVSALGAVNGLIFLGGRLYAAMGAEHALFTELGRWNPRRGSPARSLLAQATLCAAMVILVGTRTGRWVLEAAFGAAGLGGLRWEGRGGFENLLRCTAPVFWSFFLLSSLSLFVLRRRDRALHRPFPVPLYPLLPAVFTATCAYMLLSGIRYSGKLGLVGLGMALAGLPLYLVSEKLAARARPTQPMEEPHA